tara:strand:- start:387 stop:842 length:456 start_codon:yes stop_codon:yes gene_type:complete
MYCLHAAQDRAACKYFLCYAKAVNETGFINKVHKALPKEIYKWKIRDTYHGGVPDVYYSGTKGCIFIEYKYQKTIPLRPTSKIKTRTSQQQRHWLSTARMHNVPSFLVVGANDKILLTDKVTEDFFTQAYFLENAINFKTFILKLIDLCIE